ncbi:hypothetical protein [Serratia sp. P2ACOL2]|uniref:hypothetical protein n=1 Tax=Serratia sp. P2ACOL2 TaxID=2482769 RepID=UPI0013905E51|nr:hypothetical protein [Serratia sp. P2ACOL2]
MVAEGAALATKKPAAKRVGLQCKDLLLPLFLGQQLSNPALASSLSVPVSFDWPVDVVNRHIIAVNARHGPCLNTCAMKHPLCHKVSQAFNGCIPAKTAEHLAMVRNHIDRSAHSLNGFAGSRWHLKHPL